MDAQTAEARYLLEPRTERTPETIYEYRWAMALLDQVLCQLRQEFSEAGKVELFDHLQTYLVEGATEMSYAEGARRLGMSDEALRKAVQHTRSFSGRRSRTLSPARQKSRMSCGICRR